VYISSEGRFCRPPGEIMKYTLKLLSVGALAFGLGACHRHEGSTAPVAGDAKASQPMALQVYDVPQAQTETLRGALSKVLAPGGQAAITSPAPGKLLVYAPQAAQESINSALSNLAGSSKDVVPAPSLNVRFWIVDAIHGDGADDPSLNQLGDAIKSWRDSMGPAHFKLAEAVAGTLSEGSEGQILTDYQFFYSTSSVASGDVGLNLQVRNMQHPEQNSQGLQEFSGRLTVTPGQFVVLAQSPAMGNANAADAPKARLLIMRVDRAQQR
jgi:hypothetical protein